MEKLSGQTEGEKQHRTYLKDSMGWWVYGFLQFLVRAMPLRWAYFLADMAGGFKFKFSKKDRKTVEDNLRTALNLEDKLVKKYTREIFCNFCRYIMDFLSFSKFDERWFKEKVEISGLENIKKAFGLGKGIVAITLHMGSWELGAYMTRLCGFPTNGIWASHSDPKVEEFFISQRIKKGLKVILTGGALKKILRALEAKELVFFMIDYSYKKSGVEVDFLGQKAIIPEGAAIAAMKTGAAVIPAVAVRQAENPLKFNLIYGEPLEYSLSGDDEKDIRNITQKCIKAIEDFIRKYPDQWMLFRKFWKD